MQEVKRWMKVERDRKGDKNITFSQSLYRNKLFIRLSLNCMGWPADVEHSSGSFTKYSSHLNLWHSSHIHCGG